MSLNLLLNLHANLQPNNDYFILANSLAIYSLFDVYFFIKRYYINKNSASNYIAI